MKIMVSACLMGRNCKYNGGNNRNERVIEHIAGHEVVEVCPEILAGAGCPREPVEIVQGRLQTASGRDVDAMYRKGVSAAIEQARAMGVEVAILQPRSPTCGVNQVYNGTFSGTLIPGRGIFSAALSELGITVMDEEDVISTHLFGRDLAAERKT